MILLEAFGTTQGHSTFTFDDVDPDKRAGLAKTVEKILKDGHAVFVRIGETDERVIGYNSKDNTWQLAPAQKGGKKKKVSAAGTTATSVAPVSGGLL